MMSWLGFTETKTGDEDEDWRQEHDFKNQPQQSDHSILPTLVKAAKSRFNEIQSIITEAKKIRLVTTINKKFITLNDGEKLLESIISGKNYKSEAREMYNDIADGANAMNR